MSLIRQNLAEALLIVATILIAVAEAADGDQTLGWLFRIVKTWNRKTDGALEFALRVEPREEMKALHYKWIKRLSKYATVRGDK